MTAYVFCFTDKLKKRINNKELLLDLFIQSNEHLWFKLVQRDIKTSKRYLEGLKTNSGLFTDENNIPL